MITLMDIAKKSMKHIKIDTVLGVAGEDLNPGDLVTLVDGKFYRNADNRIWIGPPLKKPSNKLITLDEIFEKWRWNSYLQKLYRNKLISRGFSWMGQGNLIGTFSDFCDLARAAGWSII